MDKQQLIERTRAIVKQADCWIANAELPPLLQENTDRCFDAIAQAWLEDVEKAHIEEIEDIGQSRDIQTDGKGTYWCESCTMYVDKKEDPCACDILYAQRKERLTVLTNEDLYDAYIERAIERFRNKADGIIAQLSKSLDEIYTRSATLTNLTKDNDGEAG